MYKTTLAMFVYLLTATPNFAAEFFIIPGTKTLLMMGETSASDVSTLESYIINDKVDSLILKGPGGDLEAGYSIASLLMKFEVSVVVPENTECASACSLIFAAGKNRKMEPGSKLGFHLPFVKLGRSDIGRFCNSLKYPPGDFRNSPALAPTPMDGECLELVYQMGLKDIQRLSKYLERDGISRKVLEIVINTPSSKMHWINPREAEFFGLVNQ